MKKTIKKLVIACLLIGTTVQAVMADDMQFNITTHEPGQRAGVQYPIPSKVVVEKGWLARHKWWVILGTVIIAGAAATAGGGGGSGGGGRGDDEQTEDVVFTW